jgi:hypothetical protein
MHAEAHAQGESKHEIRPSMPLTTEMIRSWGIIPKPIPASKVVPKLTMWYFTSTINTMHWQERMRLLHVDAEKIKSNLKVQVPL